MMDRAPLDPGVKMILFLAVGALLIITTWVLIPDLFSTG